jgi:hypothetical protein
VKTRRCNAADHGGAAGPGPSSRPHEMALAAAGRLADRSIRLRLRLLLIGLPFAGGAGLVLHILAGVSLPLAIVAFACGGAVLWILLLPRLTAAARQSVRRRALIGMTGGLAGTVAYDAARYGTVALFAMSFQPFHVLRVFGEAFIGTGHSAALTFAVGAAYHLSNGVFFGAAYGLAFRRYAWWSGLLWGIGLELCMATLYPAWLRIQMLGEFLQVSAVGHVVYGSVLGLVAAHQLRTANDRRA